MNVTCPHCNQQLRFSDKFKESLKALKPGQKAKIKCTQCSQPFSVDSTMFEGTAGAHFSAVGQKEAKAIDVKPPTPPDVSWLAEGTYEEEDVVEEIPLALVLVPEDHGREEVVNAVEGLGYRAEVSESGEVAMEKMEFVNYASVILHTEFEEGGLAKSKMYRFLRNMEMGRRRYLFFALIGERLNTLYDLQALAYSANIVVNERDVQYFGTILRKAIPDYEALFGPLMEEMRVYGK